MIGLKEWLLENAGPPGQLNSLFMEVQGYLKTDEVKENKFTGMSNFMLKSLLKFGFY